MIDTHTHLNLTTFSQNLDMIIASAIKNHVNKIIIPATNLKDAKTALLISEKYPSCYASVGIHPENIKDYTKNNNLQKEMLTLLKHKKAVAIGECGLDYYWEKDPLLQKKQVDLFLFHLLLARKTSYPLIIHNRNAHFQILSTLKDFIKKTNYQPRGVFHCFSGNQQFLEQILSLGFFIGFDGNITYQKSLSPLVAKTPLDKLLLETDSPYLTPTPLKGEINQPKNLIYIAKKIAEIKNIPLDKIICQTTTNAKNLFNI